MTTETCDKKDCIARGLYSDCFLIDTQYCKFYSRLHTPKIDLRLSEEGTLEKGVVERVG